MPDVLCYMDAQNDTIGGHEIAAVSVRSPFIVRTAESLGQAAGWTAAPFRRLGKRTIWSLEDDLFLVVYLMVAGRYHWKRADTKPTRKSDLLAIHFEHGALMVTEVGARKRASLHILHSEAELQAFDLCGLEPLECAEEDFRVRLAGENHTLKRALTNPRMLSGIGNTYSDEILHAARLSPFRLTSKLQDEEWVRLYGAMQAVLSEWVGRLACDGTLPDRVTAYRKEMAVHGRYGEPCPVCATKVQRISYADGEINYC
jgi:formamidopyrimidine-DNA glycosylase